MPAAGRLLLHVLAVAAGVAVGLLGSLVHPVRVAGIPVGLVIALLLSLTVFVGCGGGLRSRGGAAAAALGWLGPVLLLSTPRPEGDLVVPGNALGYAWLLGGTVLAGLAVAVPYGDHPGGAGAASGTGDLDR